MSPLRLLLEGPDLETLLEQIRTEYGAGARIVQAEKVRRGGVGGFFARERFTIQVEVPEAEAPPGRAPKRGGSPVKSVMDLVDQLNKEDEALYRDKMEAPASTGWSGGTAPLDVVSAYSAGSALPAPARSTNPAERTVAESSAPSVSTQSASFADVMSRLEQSIDPRALAPADASWVPGFPVGMAPPPPRVYQPLTSVPEPPAAQAAQAPRAQVRSPLSTGAEMAARATAMGVPANVLAGTKDPADVYRRLLLWVESRPTAPMIVSTHGAVIVIVGEIAAAMRVAGSLARELGVDPSAIHLAVPATSTGHDVPVGRLLSDVADIAMRRQRWQYSAGCTIVVVEAALPPAARGWLTAVVAALAPTFTWAVAQASTKVDDVVSWAADIGHVDALALVNVPVTGDPAAALAGPLPIGLLDGQRATVTRWMAMLTDR